MISRVLSRMKRPFSLLPDHYNFANVTINAYTDTIGDAFGCLTGPDHARYTVLARDDRGMGKEAAIVSDDAAKKRQQYVKGLSCEFGDEHVPLGNQSEFGKTGNTTC